MTILKIYKAKILHIVKNRLPLTKYFQYSPRRLTNHLNKSLIFLKKQRIDFFNDHEIYKTLKECCKLEMEETKEFFINKGLKFNYIDHFIKTEIYEAIADLVAVERAKPLDIEKEALFMRNMIGLLKRY